MKRTSLLVFLSLFMVVVMAGYPVCSDSAGILFSKGQALYDLGKYEEAAQTWDNVLSISPDFPNASYKKGLALQHLDRQDEAIEAFDRELNNTQTSEKRSSTKNESSSSGEKNNSTLSSSGQYVPQNADIIANRGGDLLDLGRYEESIKVSKQALEMDPNLSYAWYNIGNAYGYLKRYRDANEAFDQALLIDPKMEQAWLYKGLSQDNLGKTDLAIEAYNRALRLDPNDYIVSKYLFNAMERQKQ